MKVVTSLALLVAAGWISVVGAAPKQIVAVPLNATTYNAGHIAQAILTPLSSSETALSLFVGGVPNGTAIPAHLYTYIYSGKLRQARVQAGLFTQSHRGRQLQRAGRHPTLEERASGL